MKKQIINWVWVGCLLIGGCKKAGQTESSPQAPAAGERLSAALETVEAMRREKEQTEHNWREVSDKLSALQVKYDNVMATVEELQKNVEQLRQERDEAQGRVKRALEGVDALEKLAKEKTELVRALEQENAQLENVIEALESQVTALSGTQDEPGSVDEGNNL